jgi:hypothetical protein
MKAYAFELTEPNNSKLSQGEDTALYFPPPPNVMQMLKYKEPKKKRWRIKSLNKELKTTKQS